MEPQARPGQTLARTKGRNVTMAVRKERYVVDQEGHRVGVILDMAEYHKMVEELEELESIRAYDAAKASQDRAIPFEQAVDEIERHRQ
jgi:PHD/YefM family antitoxin component YafN of YafNO toxin-antitoxin module